MLKVIGDVHGKIDKYMNICGCNEYTLQLGDLTTDNYNFLKFLDDKRHCFIPGNHDNYDLLPNKYSLMHYGYKRLGGIPFFYIRGEFSIDCKARQILEKKGYGKSWWQEEEIPIALHPSVIDYYCELQPRIVFSHGCPTSIARVIGSPKALAMFGFDHDTFETATENLLQRLFKFHQPELWVFGHFHRDIDLQVGNTRFVCLDELSVLSVDIDDSNKILLERE